MQVGWRSKAGRLSSFIQRAKMLGTRAESAVLIEERRGVLSQCGASSSLALPRLLLRRLEKGLGFACLLAQYLGMSAD
jgi:hypothetical protein